MFTHLHVAHPSFAMDASLSGGMDWFKIVSGVAMLIASVAVTKYVYNYVQLARARPS